MATNMPFYEYTFKEVSGRRVPNEILEVPWPLIQLQEALWYKIKTS